MVQPTFIPHGRDQLEVFLVENEMHSPGARVGVGDALLIKGVSQGFRSTEEDSYSGTFGKKQRNPVHNTSKQVCAFLPSFTNKNALGH